MTEIEKALLKIDFLSQKIDILSSNLSFLVENKTFNIDIHLRMNHIMDLIEDDRKIEAIKEYRLLTRVSLKESKEFIDDIYNRISKRFEKDMDHG